MFKKIFIANRGEIAVRVIRACRDMGIATVAIYEQPDLGSLHVRLADECMLLDAPGGFLNGEAVLELAQASSADAIHPGYGFLAEDYEFIEACEQAGITFIGPSAAIVTAVRNKINALALVRSKGHLTVAHSPVTFGDDELEAIPTVGDMIGYPMVVKSCRGGRGRGERLVASPKHLPEAVRRAQAEAQAVYGDRRVYLEKAIIPAHQVGVQILGDHHGNIIHLGDREGSLMVTNQKIVEESPSPCLNEEQREALWKTAVAIARYFNYQNVGTVEFLVDEKGQCYFTEIKARIQMEHPLTEMVTGVDLVREQIRVAADEPLTMTQNDVQIDGWAMICRITAADAWNSFLPSPGQFRRVRLPGGPGVRVDTYVYCGCEVPAIYDPLVAKLVVHNKDRESCVERMRRALEDFTLIGTTTNLPFLQRIMHASEFVAGRYTTDFLSHSFSETEESPQLFRDLAVAAAVYYMRRNQMTTPVVPERMKAGWHKSSRRLPQ